jgi:hypothetical protein
LIGVGLRAVTMRPSCGARSKRRAMLAPGVRWLVSSLAFVRQAPNISAGRRLLAGRKRNPLRRGKPLCC